MKNNERKDAEKLVDMFLKHNYKSKTQTIYDDLVDLVIFIYQITKLKDKLNK